MKLNVVRELLSSPSADAVQAFLDDESTVFWIDWRQEDETIAESCELTLNTGSLDGELIEKTDDGSDYHVEIIHNTKRERVPLTFSESDRHLTILTINRVLNPDYEIRFCIDSDGSDTLGFVALSPNDWNALREQFGDLVDKHFYQIADTPNLFTDPLSFA